VDEGKEEEAVEEKDGVEEDCVVSEDRRCWNGAHADVCIEKESGFSNERPH
jgi:hypothetical protein